MKNQTSVITYIAALAIGILLLCLHENGGLFQGIVIAMGILITLPSAMMLIGSFFSRPDANGVRQNASWYTVVVACAGLVLGIWMLVTPGFFVGITVYTLGVGLILVGVAQSVFIASASKPYGGANPWWYTVPILVITGGFIICFLGPNILDKAATIVTGILLIVYAFNGACALGREAKEAREIKMIENRNE